MKERNRMDATLALGEVERIDRRVRSSARRHGWIWLVVAVLTPLFFVGAYSGIGDVGLAIALGFMVIGLVLWFWESRSPVIGREAARVDTPATWAYVALVVLASILIATVLPDGFSVWLLAVGLLPSVPCLIAAWRVFQQ